MSYSIRSQKSWDETIRDLDETFRKWGVVEWYTVPRRPDLRKNWWTPDERTVTVAFLKKGEEQRFTLGTQDRPIDNLRALYLGVESMRMNDVRGIGDLVREMYLQLPAPAKVRDPYEVLGVRSDTALEDIEDLYRIKAKRAHPDAPGGSTEAMTELNDAMDRIRAERKALK